MLEVNLGEAFSGREGTFCLGALPAACLFLGLFLGVLVRGGLLLSVPHGSADGTTRTKISPRREVDVPVQDRDTPGCYSRLRVFD